MSVVLDLGWFPFHYRRSALGDYDVLSAVSLAQAWEWWWNTKVWTVSAAYSYDDTRYGWDHGFTPSRQMRTRTVLSESWTATIDISVGGRTQAHLGRPAADWGSLAGVGTFAVGAASGASSPTADRISYSGSSLRTITVDHWDPVAEEWNFYEEVEELGDEEDFYVVWRPFVDGMAYVGGEWFPSMQLEVGLPSGRKLAVPAKAGVGSIEVEWGTATVLGQSLAKFADQIFPVIGVDDGPDGAIPSLSLTVPSLSVARVSGW